MSCSHFTLYNRRHNIIILLFVQIKVKQDRVHVDHLHLVLSNKDVDKPSRKINNGTECVVRFNSDLYVLMTNDSLIRRQ